MPFFLPGLNRHFEMVLFASLVMIGEGDFFMSTLHLSVVSDNEKYDKRPFDTPFPRLQRVCNGRRCHGYRPFIGLAFLEHLRLEIF